MGFVPQNKGKTGLSYTSSFKRPFLDLVQQDKINKVLSYAHSFKFQVTL